MLIENVDFRNKELMMQAIGSAADYISGHTDKKPEIAVILGSGLGDFADLLQNADIISYEDIPAFPKPTVAGHSGRLVIGEIAGKCVAAMQGRNHYYEGYEIQTITLPVRIFAKLGVKSIILTNACGGVNKHFKPGELMIIEDHMANFCPPALRGAYLDEFGPRFIDMSKAYTPEYIAIAERASSELGIRMQKGVYGYWPGPTYETAAEVRAYAALGADVLGMSTVAETQVAASCGMKVLGISCITNMTCIISKSGTNHEEVVEMGKRTASDFISILSKCIELM